MDQFVVDLGLSPTGPSGGGPAVLFGKGTAVATAASGLTARHGHYEVVTAVR